MEYTAEYRDFQMRMAYLGFTYVLTTDVGYRELRNVGFDPDDIESIEMDMQAGFTIEESINAMGK